MCDADYNFLKSDQNLLNEKITFKQRFAEGKGVSHVEI